MMLVVHGTNMTTSIGSTWRAMYCGCITFVHPVVQILRNHHVHYFKVYFFFKRSFLKNFVFVVTVDGVLCNDKQFPMTR